MALFDSADLLARCQRLFNRPSTDEAMTSTEWYAFLSEAQNRVVTLFAFHCPEAMYGAPTLLSTADSGASYTFGTDADGANICPIGHIELRESKTGAMIPPGSEWDTSTQTFLFNADRIRWPGQKTRTFSDGPYARFVTPPNVLNGSSAPTLKPLFARELLVYDACERAAVRCGVDPTPYGAMFDARWPEILAAVQSQFSGAGRTAVEESGGLWWRGFQ